MTIRRNLGTLSANILLSIFSIQCALWGFLLEHGMGSIRYSRNGRIQPETGSLLRNQVLCWNLGPTMLHPCSRWIFRLIDLNLYHVCLHPTNLQSIVNDDDSSQPTGRAWAPTQLLSRLEFLVQHANAL